MYTCHVKDHYDDDNKIYCEIIGHILFEKLNVTENSFLLVNSLNSPSDKQHVHDRKYDIQDIIDSIERYLVCQ